MKISHPYFFNEIGKRDNQEDLIYPVHPTINDNLFMVCDGMGGHEYGEVASKVICESIATFLKTVKKENFSVDMFRRALAFAYDELDEQNASYEQKGLMGTTLTFLYLTDDKAYIAHIGDSRVYHIRTSEGQSYIVNKTSDHSLVNELLRDGIITEDEAAAHPRKNIITRAIQPAPAKRCEADISIAEDIMAGDYFFLCSDGVLESVSDDYLVEILSENLTDSEKMNKIKNCCKDSSRDNNSAYLIHIEEITCVKKVTVDLPDDEINTTNNGISIQSGQNFHESRRVMSNKNKKKKRGRLWMCILSMAILVIGIFILYKLGYISAIIEYVSDKVKLFK